MHHGSRHRRSDLQGRSRHERPQGAPTATPSRGGSRTAKAVGATVAVSLAAGVVAVVAAGAADKTAVGPTALTVTAAEDTYVYQEYPDTNRATADKLTASNQPKLHTRSYLRFAVKGVPAGVTGLTARLQFSSDRNQPAQVELRSVASTSWSSRTMTMHNAPGIGKTVAVATPDGKQKNLDFDLSSVVKGDGEYAFALVAPLANTTSAVFSSEHGSDGPRLVLDWSGTTKPAPPGRPAPTATAPGLPSMSPVKPAPTSSGKPSPSPTSTSTAPAPPSAPNGGTLFGTTVWTGDGVNMSTGLAKSRAAYGNLEIVRVFYPGLPAAWPGSAGTVGGNVEVSFKALPKDVLSGSLDSRLSTWFATAPKGRQVIWTYYHEPEDDIARGSFSAADYRAAWQHLAALADKSGNPALKSSLVLMGWSLSKQSGRNWKDYYPGSAAIDILGWDVYNLGAKKGVYNAPATVVGDIATTSRAEGKAWGVAELGSVLISGDGSGTGRAQWLRDMGAYLKSNGAYYVTYFDAPVGAEYRLFDAPSKNAWRDVVAS